VVSYVFVFSSITLAPEEEVVVAVGEAGAVMAALRVSCGETARW
jgi:hypothetical protein